MWLQGLFALGKKALDVTDNLTDADQKEKRYELKQEKQEDKAIDAAEKMFHGLGSFFNDKISKKQLRYLNKKYRKIFFDNN